MRMLRRIVARPCAVCWMVGLLGLGLPTSMGAGEPTRSVRDLRAAEAHTQHIADQFRHTLGLSASVIVTIVPRDGLLVSVARAPDRPDTFRISIEDAFLATLDDEELRAVIAHELGHVWIFTHHPYLQTEQLANRIAMRLVSRDSLARVYPKVWERTGEKGDLARFLGQ